MAMAAAGTPVAGAPAQKASRARAPRVNLADMPEIMPGAQPGANPAQRVDFEQRCRKLHDEAVREERAAAAMCAAASDEASLASSLEAMFPLLDASLVRALAAEAPTQERAVETLLALSAAMSAPGDGQADRATTPPPRLLGVEDHNKFPSLSAAPAPRHAPSAMAAADAVPEGEEAAATEDLGSAWRDRAKAAADLPGPCPVARAGATMAPARRRKEGGTKAEAPVEAQQYMTDYEFRRRAGQRRALHRARSGRGGGRGTAQAKPWGARRGAAASSTSESEASEEACGEGADGSGADAAEEARGGQELS